METPMIVACLREMANESIFDSTRVAQPDEVWNTRHGDGFEKAVTLATILHAREPDAPFTIQAVGPAATLDFAGQTHSFPTNKGLNLNLTWPLT